MIESLRDADLALEALDDAILVPAVRAHDLDGDLAEELAVPGAEDLVARTAAEDVDDDEGWIDLLALPELPAFGQRGSRGDRLSHLLLLLRTPNPCMGCAARDEDQRGRRPRRRSLLLDVARAVLDPEWPGRSNRNERRGGGLGRRLR